MDKQGSAKAFFVFQLSLTFLITIGLYPMRSGSFEWNLPVVLLGGLTGCALGLMKVLLGKALQKGPAGLTFATVSSATVMPPIIIFLLIGAMMDYQLSLRDFLGLGLVIVGLFWAGWDSSSEIKASNWLLFSFGAFACHVMYLVLTELRAQLCDLELVSSQWFVPSIFAAAAGVHLLLYIIRERRTPHIWEVSWGLIGGVFNGISATLFITATEIATLDESTFLFAIYSISLIIFCNLWGEWKYKEKINWRANLLCVSGIALGFLDYFLF